MNEITKLIIKTYVSQAMLSYALARFEDKELTTDSIAKEYADKIIEEIK